MPIQIVDGFRLNANTPIDSRMVTTGLNSRNSITYKYEGLRVYDTVDKTAYVWLENSWKPESGAGGSAGLTSLTGGLPNFITKFSTTGLTHSSIREQLVNGEWRVSMGVAVPQTKLHVNGTVQATAFVGNISGGNVLDTTLGLSKITPATNGTYVLKSINGTNQWAVETAALSVSVTNNTSLSEAFIVLVQQAGANPLLLNNNGSEKALAVNPATSQLLVSKISENNESAPGYSFRGKPNTGFYAQSASIGISWQGAKVLEGRTIRTTLYRNGNQFLQNTSTGTEISSAFTVTSGNATTLNGTLTVTDQATSLGGTLTVVGNRATTLGGTLTVAADKATTLGGTLTVAADQATSLGGNLTVAAYKNVTLTNTFIKALYSTNEFNFVNNDAYAGASGDTSICINYRGAATNGIQAYRFHNGKASGTGLADIVTKGVIAKTVRINDSVILQHIMIGNVVIKPAGAAPVIVRGTGFTISSTANNPQTAFCRVTITNPPFTALRPHVVISRTREFNDGNSNSPQANAYAYNISAYDVTYDSFMISVTADPQIVSPWPANGWFIGVTFMCIWA